MRASKDRRNSGITVSLRPRSCWSLESGRMHADFVQQAVGHDPHQPQVGGLDGLRLLNSSALRRNSSSVITQAGRARGNACCWEERNWRGFRLEHAHHSNTRALAIHELGARIKTNLRLSTTNGLSLESFVQGRCPHHKHRLLQNPVATE